MAKYPALPLFTDAYMADTRHLTTLQHGAYLLMLMTAWRTPDCALPNDDTFLSRICCLDRRTWNSNKETLLAFWKLDDKQRWVQGRLKDERNYVEEKRSKNVTAGKASALKKKDRHSTSVQPEVNETSTPTPTPTPTPTISSATQLSDFQLIFDEGCRLFPKLITANSSSIHAWLAEGCDVELDCIATLRRMSGKKDIGSWSYFTNAIADAKATRLKPMPEGRVKHERAKTDWRANQLNAIHEAAIEHERKKHAASFGEGSGQAHHGDDARAFALAAIGYTGADD